MSGTWLLIVALVSVGILLTVVDTRRKPRPEEVDFGRLGRGVLVAAVVVVLLVLGAHVAESALLRASAGDTASGPPAACEWEWWPLGATCRENVSGTDQVTITRPGWSPTAATITSAVSLGALAVSARRCRSKTLTGGHPPTSGLQHR